MIRSTQSSPAPPDYGGTSKLIQEVPTCCQICHLCLFLLLSLSHIYTYQLCLLCGPCLSFSLSLPLSLSSYISISTDHCVVVSLQVSLCVDDFQSLITLLSSMVDGQDPNCSVLLGAPRLVSDHSSSAAGTEEPHPQRQLDQVQRLREEVERLRTVVTERYADQIANDCAVQ